MSVPKDDGNEGMLEGHLSLGEVAARGHQSDSCPLGVMAVRSWCAATSTVSTHCPAAGPAVVPVLRVG